MARLARERAKKLYHSGRAEEHRTRASQERREASEPLSSVRAHAHSMAAHATEKFRLVFAESLCAEAVSAYWTALNAEVPLADCHSEYAQTSLPREASRVASQLGRALAALPVSTAAYQLGLTYTGMLPSPLRSRLGIHYTPPVLANRLLDQATAAGLDWKTARVIDPACGAGAFLVPAAERIISELGKADPAIVIKNLSTRIAGWELDPFAAWLAQVFVEATALPLVKASGRRLGEITSVRDSLQTSADARKFDLVVGNPPFGRLSLPTELREKFARSLFGHANLYGVFMDLAVRIAKDDGIVSFLTPTSFLAGEYFKNLRSVLWSEAPPVNVDFVSLRKGVFEGVLQETALATYKRGVERGSASVHFIELPNETALNVTSAGAFSLPKESTEPWLLPRHADEAKLASKLSLIPSRLAEWGYRVSTGPLVWNRHKSQLHDRAAKGRIAIVWAESITSSGEFIFRCEKRDHKPYFEVRGNDEWLIVKEPCVLLQRTTAKEQARRLIAAEMPQSFLDEQGGITVENHLNMLLPTRHNPSVSPRVLAAFLNSRTTDRVFRCISGSVAVSAYELEAMPLPPKTALRALKALVERNAGKDEIDAEVEHLYGLYQ